FRRRWCLSYRGKVRSPAPPSELNPYSWHVPSALAPILYHPDYVGKINDKFHPDKPDHSGRSSSHFWEKSDKPGDSLPNYRSAVFAPWRVVVVRTQLKQGPIDQLLIYSSLLFLNLFITVFH